jgi:ribosomal protein L12E/L44/L45/RPP1/RPP2
MAAIASKINALVATALQEAQTTTLDNFLAFLAKKEDVDLDFMTELITEFKATIDTAPAKKGSKAEKSSKKTKKSDSDESVKAAKRPPSAYNLFIKFAMTDADMKDKVMEKADPTQPKGRMLMKAAMELWAELPDSIKNKMKVMYKENPDMTGKELYDACNDAGSADEQEEKPKPAAKKPTKKPVAKAAAAAESESEQEEVAEDDD